MKAILRWGVGLVSLLLLSTVSFGQVWVTPVTKCPYPQAPSPSNGGFYTMNAYGQWTGPHYYLQPPGQPFNGFLPGKTGAAIMSGYLPHTLLLSKEGVAIGNMPMVGQSAKHGQAQPSPMPGAGLPDMGRMPPMNMQTPYGMPYGGMPPPMPYPMPMPHGGMPGPMPHGGMPYPMPHGGMPYPMPHGGMPYPMPMPYGGMPGPMPHGGMPYPMPHAGMPYPMPQGAMPWGGDPMRRQAMNWPYAAAGVYQAQNVTPPISPMMPIPNFSPSMPNPGMPGTPAMPGTPMMPTLPGLPGPPMMPGNGGFGPMGPFNYFQPVNPSFNYYNPQFDPNQPFSRFTPVQGPTPPRMDMEPMQVPRMDMAAPPPVKTGGGAYPMHPFTRSPRDFFMWGENMEDEQKLRTRPFPVPR